MEPFDRHGRTLKGMTPSKAASRRHLASSPFQTREAQVVEQLRVGDRVSHDKYGLGRVTEIWENTVTVAFGDERRALTTPCPKLTRL